MFKIKRDTAIFGPRQWYIDGYTMGPHGFFSSESDAESAAFVANSYAVKRTDNFANKVSEFMNSVDLSDD